MNIGRASIAIALALGAASPAAAQVTYRQGAAPRYANPYTQPYSADEDMSYASHPSFQIFDSPYGPQTRVIYRCAYPNGWNVTDFSRDLNGIPPGIDHTCPQTEGSRVRARY